MTTPALPLLTAAGVALAGVVSYRRPPVSAWGEAYAHLPMHLVNAAVALLVAIGVLSLVARATTERAARATRRAALSWAAVAGALSLEGAGATVDGGYGAISLHGVSAVLFATAGLVMIVSMLLLVVTRGGGVPWPLRLALLASIPAVPSATQSSSAFGLGVCLAAAAAWAAVALTAAAPRRVPALLTV